MRMFVLPGRSGASQSRVKHGTGGESVFGQSVIQHLIGAGIRCGLDDFIVFSDDSSISRIPGIRYERCSYPLSLLDDLLNCEPRLVGPSIIVYADIIFEYSVLLKLINTPGDIVLTADASFQQYLAIESHAPSVTRGLLAKAMAVRNVSVVDGSVEEADAQFVGLLKLSSRGMDWLRDTYAEFSGRYGGTRWRSASKITVDPLTDILRDMIDRGTQVTVSSVNHGWIEVDAGVDATITSRIASADLRCLLREEDVAGRPIISAGGLAVRMTAKGQECLLVGSGAVGEWRIPKGIVNPNEAVERAALREVLEETGVRCDIREHLGTSSWSYYFGGLRYEKLVHFFLMAVHYDVGEHDTEHAAVAWHKVSDAETALRYESERKIVRLAAARGEL